MSQSGPQAEALLAAALSPAAGEGAEEAGRGGGESLHLALGGHASTLATPLATPAAAAELRGCREAVAALGANLGAKEEGDEALHRPKHE